MKNFNDPVIFLGVSERAELVYDIAPQLLKWNVLGLKPYVFSTIYPLPIDELTLGFAINDSLNCNYRITIKNSEEKEIGFLQFGIPTEEIKSSTLQITEIQNSAILSITPQILFAPLKGSRMIVEAPGEHYIWREGPTEKKIIGQIGFYVAEPIPLTEDRIAAIKSDPMSSKEVRAEYGCKSCPTKLKFYAAFEKRPKTELEGYIWYQQIPDRFICECEKTQFDLSLNKRNMASLLGTNLSPNGSISFLPMYERSSLSDTRKKFAECLNAAKKEEQVQKFIEKNPIILHQFPSIRIFHKPPILTDFVADFALVTPKRELILVELEKADTRLLTKKGGESSDLTHAKDQVRQWLRKVDDHLLAVLDSLKVTSEQVSSVKGVVIAGRDSEYNKEHLRTLKGADAGSRISFYTYDDLLVALDSLINNMMLKGAQ